MISEEEQLSIDLIPTGEQIRRLRKRLKMTQAEFADLLWVTKLTVGRWESDGRQCKGPAMRLINILEHYNLWDKI